MAFGHMEKEGISGQFTFGSTSGTVTSINAYSSSSEISSSAPAKAGYVAIMGQVACYSGAINVQIYQNSGSTLRFALYNNRNYGASNVSWSIRWTYVKKS